MDFIIVANYQKDILIGKFEINNRELLENIANDILKALHKTKENQKQLLALSMILKGLLGNPLPNNEREKKVYQILKENNFEEIWNEFTKEILKNPKDKENIALHKFRELLKQKILEFKIIETITFEDLRTKNYEHIINKNNVTAIFRNGNLIFEGNSYNSRKSR